MAMVASGKKCKIKRDKVVSLSAIQKKALLSKKRRKSNPANRPTAIMSHLKRGCDSLAGVKNNLKINTGQTRFQFPLKKKSIKNCFKMIGPR